MRRRFAAAIRTSMAAMADVGAPCTWVLSNHDVVRHVTRYGGGAVGLARGRAAALMQLSLPGAVYLYNGDELGLPNVDLPDCGPAGPAVRRAAVAASAAATANGCRCPGAGRRRRSSSAPRPSPGCRCRRSGRR